MIVKNTIIEKSQISLAGYRLNLCRLKPMQNRVQERIKPSITDSIHAGKLMTEPIPLTRFNTNLSKITSAISNKDIFRFGLNFLFSSLLKANPFS